MRRRGELSCLDLCAARLRRLVGGLLPQEPHHPSPAQTVLYLGGGALNDGTLKGVPRRPAGAARAVAGGIEVMARAARRAYAVPPTVMRSKRNVGWPTPTGTP